MNRLDEILKALLAGNFAYRELLGGLRLQIRRPDQENEEWRLACYRLRNAPSTNEIATVRRYLEPLLPGVKLTLSKEQTWIGSDGYERTGRAFSWRKPEATQGALL